jgi:group I intron endonuclease
MIDIIFESKTLKEITQKCNEIYTVEGVDYLVDVFSGTSPSLREVSAAAIDYCNAWKSTFDDNVYLLTAPNGKQYAGQTSTLKTRFRDYKQGRGSNQHFSRALKKYDFDQFEIVYYTIPTACADIIEKFMILWYKLMNKDKGYNKQSGGKHGWMTSNETRAKMSAAQLGEKNHFFGKTHDEKTRAKMSILISAAMTAKIRAKISASKSGKNHPNFGKNEITLMIFEL